MPTNTVTTSAGSVRDLRVELETLVWTTWGSVADEWSRVRFSRAVKSPAVFVLGWIAALGVPSWESAAVAARDGLGRRPIGETHGYTIVDRALTRC